jgi:hypothetical protein
MVSNARLDLPDPERPVMTTRLSRGISSEMFFRLWTRAPCTAIVVRGAEAFSGLLRAFCHDGGFVAALEAMRRLRQEEGELLHLYIASFREMHRH